MNYKKVSQVKEIAQLLQSTYKTWHLFTMPDGGVVISYIMTEDQFPREGFSMEYHVYERLKEDYPELVPTRRGRKTKRK
jgi:hypothetical protein